MEGCGLNCIKYLLFVFNLIFAVAGIGLIVAGSLVLVQANYDLLEGQGQGPAIALIVIGAFIFITAFLGCCGAIKENYCMLVTFAVILIITFIVQLSVGIVAAVYKDNFQDEFQKELNDSLKNYETSSLTREAWSAVQTDFKCCGVRSYNDWNLGGGRQLPASCCGDVDPSTNAAHQMCQKASVKYRDGCYDILAKLVKDGLVVTLAVAIGIAFMELAGAILACFLAWNVRSQGKEETA